MAVTVDKETKLLEVKVNSIAIIVNCLTLPEDDEYSTQNTAEFDALLNEKKIILTGIGYKVHLLTREKSVPIQQFFRDLQNKLCEENDNVFDVFILVIGFVRNTVIIDSYNTTIPMSNIVNEFAAVIPHGKIHLYLMLTHSPLVPDAQTTDVTNAMVPLSLADFLSASHSYYRQQVVRLGNERGSHFYKKLNPRVNFVFSALPIWLGPTENQQRFSDQCSLSAIVLSLREGREEHLQWSAVAETIRNRIVILSEEVDGLKPIVFTGDNFHL